MAVFALCLAGNPSPAAAQDWARAMFPVTNHDFGAVVRGAKAEYAFELTNNLKGDVHIASVRSSCGCTSPRIEKQTLKTYEKGAIIAHLNSDTYLGSRGATVTVTIDQPAYAEVQLQVRAYVHGNVLMEPQSVEFGSVQQGQPSETTVRLYRSDFYGWQISGVKFSNANLSGEVVERGRRGSEVWYDLKVRLAKTTSAGYLNEYALLSTNDPSAAQITVQVGGQVQPEVTVSPSSIFLGTLRAGEQNTKPLVVRATKPFRIKSVAADKNAFQIPQPGTEAKPLHIVPVTFQAGSEIGRVVKTVRIETDLGGADVTFYAVVEEK